MSTRDRLALRIMGWIAAVLLTDAIDPELRRELKAIRTSVQVER